MQNQLQKAIDLAKKTGDRLIVFDPKNIDNIYVIMSLDDYEKLVIGHSEVRNLTEDQLLDKINRDIAIWKSEQEIIEEPLVENLENRSFSPILESAFNFNNREGESEIKTKTRKRQHWSIPRSRKESAEEIIEEDRQYLEEI